MPEPDDQPTALTVRTEAAPLTQYLPRDGAGLMALAKQVAESRMFMNGQNPLTPPQAFVVMMKGAELGLSPMQSLEHISIIKGKPFVGAAVITARLRQHASLTKWEVDSSDKHCTITFGRRGEGEKSLTTKIEDIPQRYFATSRNGEPSNWTLIPEDMLFAWTVRRVARRHFPDALLDLGDAVMERHERVVDVAAVEHAIGVENAVDECQKCGGRTYLHAAGSGGAFSSCSVCGHTQAPPQAARDAMRGTPPALLIEAEPEPELPPWNDRRDLLVTALVAHCNAMHKRPSGDAERVATGAALSDAGWEPGGDVPATDWIITADEAILERLAKVLKIDEGAPA